MARRDVHVYAAIAEAIKERIASGEWKAGQRLPSIHQLARQFGAGTGSIREAARVLEAEGLLRIEHGRGLFVAEHTLSRGAVAKLRDVGAGSVLALLEARRILEPELASLAAERASAEDRLSIHELAADMARLVEAGADVMEFMEPDVLFHQRIARAAQNAVLASMMEGVYDLLLESRRLSAQSPGMNERAARYHLLIADAIADRNPLQARLLMLAHINDAVDAVVGLQGRQPGPDARTTSQVLLEQRALQLGS